MAFQTKHKRLKDTTEHSTEKATGDWHWEGNGQEEVRTLLTQLQGLDFTFAGIYTEAAEPDLDCNENMHNMHNVLHSGPCNSEFSLSKHKHLRVFQGEVISVPPSRGKKGSMT